MSQTVFDNTLFCLLSLPGMIIYGNDSDYTNSFKQKVNATVVENEDFTIKNDDGDLVITFSSGKSVTFLNRPPLLLIKEIERQKYEQQCV